MQAQSLYLLKIPGALCECVCVWIVSYVNYKNIFDVPEIFGWIQCKELNDMQSYKTLLEGSVTPHWSETFSTHVVLRLCQIPIQERQWHHPYRGLQHRLLPLPAVYTGLQPGLHFPGLCQPSRDTCCCLLPLPSYRHHWTGHLEPGDRGPQTYHPFPCSSDQRSVFIAELLLWGMDKCVIQRATVWS